MNDNKVKWGLRNVWFAVAHIADDGSATYDAPKRWPGAVNLNMDAEGDATRFRADNIDYWVGQSNSGYSGDFESALIPESFRADVLGELKDANGIEYEYVEAPTVDFALMFQFEGDVKGTRHVLYRCTATRPAVAGQTTEETLEPQTETLELTAGSIYVPAIDKNVVKARCLQGDPGYENFFSAVPIPGAAVVTHTVTFDSDGGSAVAAQTVVDGQTATEPTAPTRGTDTFDGWTLNGVAYDFTTPVTADITLVAQWS